MSSTRIGTRPIGAGHSAYIIAEAGFNHGGDTSLAADMIDAAADAGADAIKFQTFEAEKLILDSATHFPTIRNVQLSDADYEALAARAKSKGIDFLSTPFDTVSLAMLDGLGMKAFKIASMDVNNLPLLRAAAATGKTVLLSTGMSVISEVETAVEAMKTAGSSDIVLLHCISEYPTPADHAHVLTIGQLRAAFDLPVGYSDHVLNLGAALAAAAHGAAVIEKHFTVDTSLPGADHSISADPEELSKLVALVREVEASLGVPCADENRPDRAFAKDFRRSVHARTDIPAGTPITEDMLAVVRPGNGLPPAAATDIVGRSAATDIPRNAAIQLDQLK